MMWMQSSMTVATAAPVKGVFQHGLLGPASPGVQPKPPSKLRHATKYCTARGTSMACNRSRIEHVSSAQYENLYTGDGEVYSDHLCQPRNKHSLAGTSRSTVNAPCVHLTPLVSGKRAIFPL
jgi:hypothetical protein